MTRVEKNTVNQFFGSKKLGFIFLKMREYQKKVALKEEVEASLYTLDWGFKKIQCTLYNYVVAKILRNSAKFRNAKAGFKNYRNFQQLQTSSGKSKKLKFDGLLSKKNRFLQFWNQKYFFTTQLFCIAFAQTLHSFHKSSPSKCKFSDFSTTQVKFHHILYVIFQIKSDFFFKV